MEIIEIKTLRGPNYWSIKWQHLIEMKLDLGKYEYLPTNEIEGFGDRLKSLMPSLYSHHCSIGTEGGFFERIEEGTWLGHVIEHVALEMQSLAGMDCGFGRTRSAENIGVYHVVFAYLSENAGKYVAKSAVDLVEALAEGHEYPVQQDIQLLKEIYEQEKLGPSTQSILDEAKKRNIPFKKQDINSMVILGQGKNQRIISATVADSTSNIAVELVQDKHAAKQVLKEAYVPVPEGTTIEREDEIQAALANIGFPVVVKPLDGNHGRGITTGLSTYKEVVAAFFLAKQVSEKIIIERYIKGQDYRLLVIDFKFQAAAKRTPAKITGNGFSTIQQLIDKENSNPNRGIDHEQLLTTIKVDENTKSILSKHNLTLDDVLPFGYSLILKDTANLSSGGTAEDVTDLIHQDNIFLAERTARLMNLNICGIDLIANDISVPVTPENGAVLEVNAAPGFRMHQFPSAGTPRNVAAAVLDMLYPDGMSSRIPITAVTGTNGKTTTTRLLAHLAMTAGKKVGYTTTDGIYLNNNLISKGDCSGPGSAAVVLRDPMVDYAVLECARGGILRSGLGFDRCNISIVTNVSEDHLGIDGISNLEKLARVKSIVPETTFEDGYAILNADDDLVYNMKENLSCNIALFSIDLSNQRLATHCASGGVAAFVDNEWVVVSRGYFKTRFLKVKDIPLTLEGKSECMLQNTLAAVLAATLSGFSLDTIQSGLKSFFPSPQLNPGRMNIFHISHNKLIVDYAHNVGGFQQIQKFLGKEKVTSKTGIIGVPGDRRDQDIVAIGELAAEIFDEIIIRHDINGRGRTKEEVTELLLQGIRHNKYNKPVRIVSDEKEALESALHTAPPGSLIFVSCENVHEVLNYVEELVTVETLNPKQYGT
jgi:cyanophycin synthetase